METTSDGFSIYFIGTNTLTLQHSCQSLLRQCWCGFQHMSGLDLSLYLCSEMFSYEILAVNRKERQSGGFLLEYLYRIVSTLSPFFPFQQSVYVNYCTGSHKLLNIKSTVLTLSKHYEFYIFISISTLESMHMPWSKRNDCKAAGLN